MQHFINQTTLEMNQQINWLAEQLFAALVVMYSKLGLNALILWRKTSDAAGDVLCAVCKSSSSVITDTFVFTVSASQTDTSQISKRSFRAEWSLYGASITIFPLFFSFLGVGVKVRLSLFWKCVFCHVKGRGTLRKRMRKASGAFDSSQPDIPRFLSRLNSHQLNDEFSTQQSRF